MKTQIPNENQVAVYQPNHKHYNEKKIIDIEMVDTSLFIIKIICNNHHKNPKTNTKKDKQ